MSKRLTEMERDDMNRKMSNLSEKRIQMAEFPLRDSDLLSFWFSLTPKHIVDAIKVLYEDEVYKSMIDTTYRMVVVVGEYKLDIDTNMTMPILDHYNRKSSEVPEGHEMYKPLHDFCELRKRVDEESYTFRWQARGLINAANAAGQIKRVWPELASMLGYEAKESIRQVERASRVPGGFNLAEFNSNRDMLNRVLAEARILPDIGGQSIIINVSDR